MAKIKKVTAEKVESMFKTHNIVRSGFSFVFFCIVYEKGKWMVEEFLKDKKFMNEFNKLNKKYIQEWEDMDEKNYDNEKELINKYHAKLL